MKKFSRGEAHTVIIIVLVVALLGALGYIFYANFIAKKADTSKQDSDDSKVAETPKQEAPKEELTTVTLNDIFKPGLAYAYPKSWSERRASSGSVPITEDGSTAQNSIVTTADKTIDVTISMVVGGGIGGACMPEEVKNLDWFAYEKSKNLSGFAYVEYIYQDQYQNNQWVVQQGLGSSDKATTIKAGDSSCDVRYATITPLSKITTVGQGAMLNTNITPYGKDGRVGFATLAEAKAYLASDNAKRIKQIFLTIQ